MVIIVEIRKKTKSQRDTPDTKIGKVLRVYRIKPHAPPLVRASSIPLSLTLRPHSPGGVSRVSFKPPQAPSKNFIQIFPMQKDVEHS